jgi:IS30 family transposase
MLGGQGGGALLTVVERKSRFTCIARLPSKQSEVVTEALIEILRPYKKQVETVTVDNGNEFAPHLKVSKALWVQLLSAPLAVCERPKANWYIFCLFTRPPRRST